MYRPKAIRRALCRCWTSARWQFPTVPAIATPIPFATSCRIPRLASSSLSRQAGAFRVSGRAMIVRDLALRQSMAIHGKTPEFAIVVTIDEAFLHCAKCVIRSGIWEQEKWPTWTIWRR